MKTELEVLDGVLVIKNDAEGLKAVLDVTTGDIINLECADVNIVRLRMFVNKVYARYAKYVSTNDIS